MKKPMIRIHDLSTNEIIDREMTNDEFAQHKANLLIEEKYNAQIKAKELQRQAIADRLGLTADELKVLFG
jgi:hypothetical protein